MPHRTTRRLPVAALILTVGCAIAAFSGVAPTSASVGDPAPAHRPEHLMSAGYNVVLQRPDNSTARYWMDLPQFRVDGELTWAFCVDADNRYENGSGTIEAAIETTPPAVLAKVRRVLSLLDLREPADTVTTPYIGWPLADAPDPSGYGRAPQRAEDRLDAIAGQLAIWHYTDGLSIAGGENFAEDGLAPGPALSQWDNAHVTQAEITARVAELIAAADADPSAEVAPHPTVTVNPPANTATLGSTVLMDIVGTGTSSISVTANNGASLHPVDHGACDRSTTITELPGNGSQICVQVTTAGPTIVSANGSAVWVQGDIISFSSDQARVVARRTTLAHGAADASATIEVTTPATTSTTTPDSSEVVATPTSAVPVTVAGNTSSRDLTGTPPRPSTPEGLASTGADSGVLAMAGMGSILLGLSARRLGRRSVS